VWQLAGIPSCIASWRTPSEVKRLVTGGRWPRWPSLAAGGRCHGATAQSAFELASVTKTFTALLLTVLSVQQRISLDDLLGRYLPAAAGAPTRLVDLATHSAGYPRLPRAIVRYGLSRDPYARLTDRQIDREVRRLSRLTSATGHPVSYSNLGFGVLSRALAAAGGRPFGELLTAEVLRPLGLTITFDTEPGPDRCPGTVTTGAARRGGTTPRSPAPGGGGQAGGRLVGYRLASTSRTSIVRNVTPGGAPGGASPTLI
jgi:CubicO group peptidase (beta-lactamase class C family)